MSYMFLLILIEGVQGKFEVLKKLSPVMQTPNCLHSAAETFKGALMTMN